MMDISEISLADLRSMGRTHMLNLSPQQQEDFWVIKPKIQDTQVHMLGM